MWRHVLLITALLAPGIPAVAPLLGVRDGPVSQGVWALIIVSAFVNLGVLQYHWTVPPHPKFLMLPWRRFWIRVHVISGSVEYLAGVAFLLLPNQVWPGVLMACVALGLHVPSAFAQNRIVSGSRAVMVPAYIICIVGHALCAILLLRNPGSTLWAVNTFLMFNTYAWVRVYGMVFDHLKLFASMKYTAMVLAAGLTTLTPVFGPLVPVLGGVMIGSYVIAWRALFAKNDADFLDFVRERARVSGINLAAAEAWARTQDPAVQQRQARELFDLIDADADGRLDRDELRSILLGWHLETDLVETFVATMPHGVDFDLFFDRVWSLGTVRARGVTAVQLRELKSARDRAQFVFDMLDVDGDGVLSASELKLLLLEWALPPEETEKYFAVCDLDGDGKIAFNEFFRGMRPVWRFLFYDVMSAQTAASGGGLAQDQPDFHADAREAKAVHHRVREELAGRVPFLRGAPPALVHDLADSLVTERFSAGDVVFQEWAPGDRCYILAEGTVQVLRAGEPVAALHRGASFGEAALITDEGRNASVIATTDCVLYSLTRSSFEYLTTSYPEVRTQLAALHRERTGYNARRALDVFLPQIGITPDSAPTGLVSGLVERFAEQRHRAGEAVFKEGDAGDSFAVIATGRLLVVRDGKPVVRLGPGHWFGEAALLTGTPRNATVICETDAVLYRLLSSDFKAVLGLHPTIATTILDVHRTRTLPTPGDA